ncbi:MAG TPA: hypothetical protein VHG52_08580 [Thermomicrobiales bacterium]|nr:hypothetical protein [Thermomicrobiales bacterium]
MILLARSFACVALVLLIALSMAGCTTPTGDTPDANAPRLSVATSYAESAREEAYRSHPHTRISFPEGHGANHQYVQVSVEPLPGRSYSSWKGTPSCVKGVTHQDEPSRSRETDCTPAAGRSEHVLPPPQRAGLLYPLDGEGRIVFVVSEPMLVAISLSDAIREPLLSDLEDSEACGGGRFPEVSGTPSSFSGGVARSGAWKTHVGSSGSLVISFFGHCTPYP